jgi:hypothetical protein
VGFLIEIAAKNPATIWWASEQACCLVPVFILRDFPDFSPANYPDFPNLSPMLLCDKYSRCFPIIWILPYSNTKNGSDDPDPFQNFPDPEHW